MRAYGVHLKCINNPYKHGHRASNGCALSEEKEEGDWMNSTHVILISLRLCKQNEHSRISCVPKCCVCSSWAEPRTRPLWRACTRRKTTMRLNTNLALKLSSSSQKSDRCVKCVHWSMFSWQRRVHCLLFSTAHRCDRADCEWGCACTEWACDATRASDWLLAAVDLYSSRGHPHVSVSQHKPLAQKHAFSRTLRWFSTEHGSQSIFVPVKYSLV